MLILGQTDAANCVYLKRETFRSVISDTDMQLIVCSGIKKPSVLLVLAQTYGANCVFLDIKKPSVLLVLGQRDAANCVFLNKETFRSVSSGTERRS